MLKISKPIEGNNNITKESKVDCDVQKQHLQEKQQEQQPLKHSESVVVTTKWETFD